MGWCASRNGPCSDKEVEELKPHKTTHGWGDVDGYYVPPGYQFKVEYQRAVTDDTKWFGPGWHKITDDNVAEIKSYRPVPR
jgi:hypothetical protein